jgi:hypothetical protein
LYDGSDRYNQKNNNHCREMAVRASYDLMRKRYYESAADPSQNPTWLQRGGKILKHINYIYIYF